MWSLAGEHTCDPAHSPFYISPRMDTREDEADELTPHGGLLGLPVLSWAGGYDRLAVDDHLRLLKMTEASVPAAPTSRTLEPSPSSADRAVNPPCEAPGPMEERCLEQVQSMVLGEVLKDIDKACRLLNITPGTTCERRQSAVCSPTDSGSGVMPQETLLFTSSRQDKSHQTQVVC